MSIKEVKKEEAESFLNGRKKAEVVTDLIANKGYDLGKAEKFWDTYGKGLSATGFIEGFDKALLEKDFNAKAVEVYVKANGTANTLRHLSSYVTRAKLGTALRAKFKAEAEAKAKK